MNNSFMLLDSQTFHFHWAFLSALCFCYGWPAGSYSLAMAP